MINRLLPLLLAAALFVFLSGCAKKSDEDEEEQKKPSDVTVEVQSAKVEQGQVRQLIPANGSLEALPNRDVKVSALVAGRISEIGATEGDAVAKGAVLARLDASTFEAQVKQAKAKLENAQQNQQRAQRLFEKGISARKEVEDANRDLAVAQGEYDTADTQLSRTVVRSPIAGVVVKRFVNVGEQVDGTAAQPVAEVADPDPIEVAASLQVSYLPLVKERENAEVRTEAFGNQAFHGKVISVLPAIDPQANTATVRIQIPNADHRLKTGMFATVSIIADTHPNALYVPPGAISTVNEQPSVFLIGPDSRAHQRGVKLGWRDGERVEIFGNVKKGDQVVTTGSYGLAEGMKVAVQKGGQPQTQSRLKTMQDPRCKMQELASCILHSASFS